MRKNDAYTVLRQLTSKNLNITPNRNRKNLKNLTMNK